MHSKIYFLVVSTLLIMSNVTVAIPADNHTETLAWDRQAATVPQQAEKLVQYLLRKAHDQKQLVILEHVMTHHDDRYLKMILPVVSEHAKLWALAHVLETQDRKRVRCFLNSGMSENDLLKSAINYCGMKEIEFALSLGADPCKKFSDGTPPILLAAQLDHPDTIAIVKYLISQGAGMDEYFDDWLSNEPFQDTPFGYTPLMAAARNGNRELVAYLLDLGADLHARDTAGHSPFGEAVKFAVTPPDSRNAQSPEERLAFVSWMLDLGANIQLADREGWTPFLQAVEHQNHALINLFVRRGADTRVHTNDGCTALHLALAHTDPLLIDKMLYLDVDIHAQRSDGCSALMLAVKGQHQTAVEKLLRMGAEVNAKDQQGQTALFYAVRASSDKMIQALLDRGADLSVRDRRGITLLMHALTDEFFSEDRIRFLLKHEAVRQTINARTDRGETTLTLFLKRSNIDPSFGFDTPEPDASSKDMIRISELLMSHGAKWAESAKIGPTVLPHECIESPELLRYLVEKGMDLTQTDSEGRNVLMVPCFSTTPELFDYLIAHGADPHLRDKQGRTLLMHLCRKGNDDLLAWIMSKQPYSLNEQDHAGNTALMYAAQSQNKVVIEWLLQSGARLDVVNKHGKHAGMFLWDKPYSFSPIVEQWTELREIFKQFRKLGLSLDQRDGKGDTMLMYAARQNMVYVIFLLEEGADINAQNNEGETVLLQAVAQAKGGCDSPFEASGPEKEMILLLLRAGADVNVIARDGSTALDRAQTEDVREQLVRAGAKTSETLHEEERRRSKSNPPEMGWGMP